MVWVGSSCWGLGVSAGQETPKASKFLICYNPTASIQDFEPFFYQKSDKRYLSALKSYSQLDRVTGFTKTEWNADIVANLGVQRPHVVGASVNLESFRPKGRNIGPEEEIRIVAMVLLSPKQQNYLALARSFRCFSALPVLTVPFVLDLAAIRREQCPRLEVAAAPRG